MKEYKKYNLMKGNRMGELIDWSEEQVETFQGDALEYLQGIYKGLHKFDPQRFRAANAAVPYERPKLLAAAIMHPNGSFAERLEKAISRSQAPPKCIEPKVIDHQPQIEHDRSELGPTPRKRPNSFIRRI